MCSIAINRRLCLDRWVSALESCKGKTDWPIGARWAGDPWPLVVHVYHPESDFKKLLDFKYACDAEGEGNTVCHSTDEDEPPRKKPKYGDGSTYGAGVGDPGQGSSRSGQAPTAPGTSAPGTSAPDSPSVQQCGGRCRHWDDCRGSHCRCGRTRVNPVDRSNSFLTCQHLPKPEQAINDIKPLATLCTHGRCLLMNTTNDNTTNDEATLKILTRPNATIADGVMECTCNCTYISPACCFATDGIVREPLSASSSAVLPTLDNNTCCDSTTGKWRNGTVVRDSSDENALCSE